MINCPKCGKDNQDHYKFCLGCGAELGRDALPKGPSPMTPSQGLRPLPGNAPAAVHPGPATPPPTTCPQCGHVNAPSNVFCGSCGYRILAPSAGAQRPMAGPTADAATPSTVVLTALRADGSEAGNFRLPTSHSTVGRETGGIFAGDSYLSPRHASFHQSTSKLTVRDEGSLNGIYKKLVRDIPVELKPNDIFRIGQEIIRFEPLAPLPPSTDGVERLGSPARGYVGRIALVTGRDETGNAFPVPESGIHLGRERGDILFPEDGYVSGLHCRLTWETSRLFLTDLGSSNGTFIRILNETEIRGGDVLLMGQQLFRVSV